MKQDREGWVFVRWEEMCNVLPLRGRASLHRAVFVGHRLPSQTNINLFYALCPQSCILKKNFLVNHRPTSVFSTYFVLTRAHPKRTSRLITHPWIISLGQAHLTLEFFRDRLLEKKLKLIDMSILLIILSPRSGCYILTSLRDWRPRRSTLSPY